MKIFWKLVIWTNGFSINFESLFIPNICRRFVWDLSLNSKSLSGNAATVIRGLLSFMLGTSLKFSYLQIDPFPLPEVIDLHECELKNERHFIEFILRNDWVQRRVGIKISASNGLFPDIIGEIYDKKGGAIRVEAEYWAENFAAHGHDFRGCDLILSFLRTPEVRFIKGVPVWSFYSAYKSKKYAQLTLYDDILTDFDRLSEQDESESKPLFKSASRCIICGNPIYASNRKYCSKNCKREAHLDKMEMKYLQKIRNIK